MSILFFKYAVPTTQYSPRGLLGNHVTQSAAGFENRPLLSSVFLSGRSSQHSHCTELLSTSKAQWLLYVPPGSTVQNSTFCLHLDL